MPCYSPLTAYYGKDIGKSGKRSITFDRNAAFSGVKLSLPCGQCVGCRLERSRQWAIRCMHEKQMHAENSFVTLTYDPAHLPPGGSLVKRDLQLFMKRLRKRRGDGIRFYACGEYGELSRRPHYHLILFNCDFADKRFYKFAKRGERLYTSQEVRELWPLGHNVIGNVDFDSCAYVARYIMKKVTGPRAEDFYMWTDADGVIHQVIPEFTVMSRRPGIGLDWFDKYGEHAYEWDSVIMNGREIRPPRYYDVKYDLVHAAALADLKRKRRRAALRHKSDQTPERRRVCERVEELRLSQFKREV